MDLSSLSPQQAAELGRRLGPMLGYLVKLTDRMQKCGWDSTDRVYARAWQARDALHEVCVRLHYASCGPGHAGNPGPEPAPPTELPRWAGPPPEEPGGSEGA